MYGERMLFERMPTYSLCRVWEAGDGVGTGNKGPVGGGQKHEKCVETGEETDVKEVWHEKRTRRRMSRMTYDDRGARSVKWRARGWAIEAGALIIGRDGACRRDGWVPCDVWKDSGARRDG